MWMKQEEKLRKGRAARPFQFGKLEVVWSTRASGLRISLHFDLHGIFKVNGKSSSLKVIAKRWMRCIIDVFSVAKPQSSYHRALVSATGEEKSQSINVGSNDLVRTKAANSKSALTQKLLVEIWKHLRVKCRYVTTQKSNSGMEFFRFEFVFDWN